jgi:hypothetical protein
MQGVKRVSRYKNGQAGVPMRSEGMKASRLMALAGNCTKNYMTVLIETQKYFQFPLNVFS